MNGIKKIVVILPVHNRKDITIECLEYIRKQTIKSETIVVADNCSDGTEREVKKSFPEVIIINTKKDLFWTGSMKIGVGYALKNFPDAKYILSLNDDTYFGEDYFKNLINFSEKNPNNIIGSACFNYYRRNELFYNKIKVDWKKYEFRHYSKHDEGGLFSSNDVLPGRGTLFPVDALKKESYNPEIFPQYLGDYDISIRLKRYGYGLLIDYNSKIYSRRELTIDIGRDRKKISAREAIKFLTQNTPLNFKHNFKFIMRHCYGRKLFCVASMVKNIFKQTVLKIF